ncbi:TetR/AcrR family transcriptional regulator [Rhodococcus erythropolis]|uniref:TetR/AcrR family transcriptional regulator n=1 Tax=Rhodococcus erythropolis TaxID=1833 RepID=UPI003D0C38ED
MFASDSAPRSRPKNRKHQIVCAARGRIVAAGYRNVSMTQVAGDVGITAGALYRHFPSKSMLLVAVIESSFDSVDPMFEGSDSLTTALTKVCSYVAHRRDVGVLWWRELHHAPAELHGELRTRLRRMASGLAEALLKERSDLLASEAEQLAWGIHAVLVSASWHSTSIGATELAALLHSASQALAAAEIPSARSLRRESRFELTSKREKVLAQAIGIFGSDGFDIAMSGAASKVTGANLYSYFPTKDDLARAVTERVMHTLWTLLHSVLDNAHSPAQAVCTLVDGYVCLALDRKILTTLLLDGPLSMSARDQQQQTELFAEWSALLTAANPEMTVRCAQRALQTTLGFVHTAVLVDRVGLCTISREVLVALTLAVLANA